MKEIICGMIAIGLLGGCGSNNDKQASREPVAPSNPTVEPTSSLPVAGNQPTVPLKTPEDECRDRAVDFDWLDGKCVEKPNIPITGKLSISTGTIWAPNSENCTQVYRYDSGNKPKDYRRCAGLDVTIPLAKPPIGVGVNTLKIGYNCSMVIEFPVAISLGSTQASVSPRSDDQSVFSVSTPIEADSDLTVSIKLAPDYSKVFGGFAVDFPEACRIFVLENSASPAN